jgi:hypothetical protein
MDNSDLLRGLSSSTVQIFGVALIVLILALSADNLSVARPIAIIAALVMLGVIANWIGHALTRSHPGRQSHEHH